jgi:hypothetical protein
MNQHMMPPLIAILTTIAFVILSMWRSLTVRKVLSGNGSPKDLLYYGYRLRLRAGQHFFGSLVLLTVLMLVKGGLVYFGRFVDSPLYFLAFGSAQNAGFFDTFGLMGAVLMAIKVYSLYQHVKTKHYQQVLYAFRRQLELEEEFRHWT